MRTAQLKNDSSEKLTTAGIYFAYLLSVWLLNSLLNIVNYGFWASQDGSGTPIAWNAIVTKRIVSPMLGWDHNAISMAFPWLIILLAAFVPSRLNRMSPKALVGVSFAFFIVFWLAHDPSSFSSNYVPYYISVGLRTSILILYAAFVGFAVRSRFRGSAGLAS